MTRMIIIEATKEAEETYLKTFDAPVDYALPQPIRPTIWLFDDKDPYHRLYLSGSHKTYLPGERVYFDNGGSPNIRELVFMEIHPPLRENR